MKKLFIGAAAVIAIAAPLAAVAPAHATAGDSRPGVCTAKEYRAVHNGMTKAKVARILDGPGKQSFAYNIAGTRYETRDYGRIAAYTTMCSVDFENGKVTSKFRISTNTMTDPENNYRPGDIANGHILIEGEGWVPLAEHQRRLAASRSRMVQPPGYPTQAVKKSHTLRNVLLVLMLLFVLFVGGCFALVGAVGHGISESIEEEAKSDVPTKVIEGRALRARRVLSRERLEGRPGGVRRCHHQGSEGHA